MYFQVQVGSGGVARGADDPDRLAGGDLLTDLKLRADQLVATAGEPSVSQEYGWPSREALQRIRVTVPAAASG